MKRSVIQAFAGLASAGMLAGAFFAGTNEIGKVQTQETVEYKMEENAADLTSSGSQVTNYKDFMEYYNSKRQSEPDSYKGVAVVHSIGYSGDVMLISHRRSDCHMLEVCTYTKDGRVRTIGTLTNIMYGTYSYKDGVIWSYDTFGNTYTFASYVVTSDGSKLVHKDYGKHNVGLEENPRDDTYYVYTNSTNNESNKKKVSGNTQQVFDDYLRRAMRIPKIQFCRSITGVSGNVGAPLLVGED